MKPKPTNPELLIYGLILVLLLVVIILTLCSPEVFVVNPVYQKF